MGCNREETSLHKNYYPCGNMSVSEGICCGQESLGDDLVSKMIEDFDRRGKLGGFNWNQIKDVFRGFGIR